MKTNNYQKRPLSELREIDDLSKLTELGLTRRPGTVDAATSSEPTTSEERPARRSNRPSARDTRRPERKAEAKHASSDNKSERSERPAKVEKPARRAEAKKSNEKKSEPKKADSKKVDAKKADTKKPEGRKGSRSGGSSRATINAKNIGKTLVRSSITSSKTKKDNSAVVRDKNSELKIIPIGGLNEIGKNCTVLECNDQIMIIDCGMSFPEDEMLGIDVVIPDFSYLIKNAAKIKGLVLTHGHEDHIGGVPYLLKNINIPIYGTKLTLGLVENKLQEHNIQANLNIVKAGETIKLGCFSVETIRTTHSVADAICMAIDTPAGLVFHTGDFKIDYTPIDGEPIDFTKLADLRRRGVKLMMADSTNALRPGFTASEKVVGQTLDAIMRDVESRIIIATFSSNVHRVQKIIDIAAKYGRKVAISGRSMENVVALSTELGYLNIPANTVVDIKQIKNIPDKELIIITTGSQGEPMSALSRMAAGEHRAVKLKKGDMVILSSTPVPGNEKTVTNVVNKLFEQEVNVIYSDIADIHVSGHACQEELKLMHSMIKPEYFMPVHGELRHLTQHAKLAQSLGMDEKKIFILENGDTLSLSQKNVAKTEKAVTAGAILVDGLGIGDVGNAVLKERRLLSESGIIIVSAAVDRKYGLILSGPDIITRGFVYVKENEDIIKDLEGVAREALEKALTGKTKDWNTIKNIVKDELRTYIFVRTKRNPILLPILIEL